MDLQTVDKLLTTTRSVRQRLDFTRPVEPEVIQECLEIAIQAPTGSNRQNWRFVVVTDADKRAQIAAHYKESFIQYANWATGELAEKQRTDRVRQSSGYLAENMHQAPVLIIPCYEGRVAESGQMAQAAHYGSILPATWSLMLALRARGLGAAWTTLHLRYADQVAALLNIPDTMTQAALLPVAYFTGDDFKPAQRQPARELTYWDEWGRGM
jgi:nitroreductase